VVREAVAPVPAWGRQPSAPWEPNLRPAFQFFGEALAVYLRDSHQADVGAGLDLRDQFLAFLGDRQHDGDGTVQQPGHHLDEGRAKQLHLTHLVDQVDIYFPSNDQFFLHQRLKVLGFDTVAADPVPGPRPDVGQERPPARQGNGLEADLLPSLAGLLGVEAGQA